MIDGLIGGRLYGKPAQRNGQNSRKFVTAKVRAPAADGDGIYINVIAFDADVGAALLALDHGDSVSLSGSLTPKAWTDRNGDARPSLDMVVHALLTPYHVSRKRRAMSNQAQQEEPGFADEPL